MNVTKIIGEELGQELEKEGFQPAARGRGVWPYERNKNGVKQTITIITDRYSRKLLQVLFDTDAYGQMTEEFRSFVPSEEDAGHQDFWRYDNEEELRAVLREFKRLILMYGLKHLETMSKPTTDAVPSEEMERYLYQNHAKLYEEYSAELQTQGKSAEEAIEIITQTMIQNREKPFADVKDLLIGLAALYGHTISWGDRGDWVWDEKLKECWLENILGTSVSIALLTCIFPKWDSLRRNGPNPAVNSLLHRYNVIKVFYYRDHPEEKKQK